MKKIKFLNNKEINRIQWDKCVLNSINSKVYALSWYLDIVSDEWNGLVYGDYELVFPIVIKKKLFFNNIIHPLFCQQLGPFSPSPLLLNPGTFFDIIFFLDNKFKKFEFSINHDCSKFFKKQIQDSYPHIKCIDRVNLELDLIKDYESIFDNYTTNAKRHLKKNQDSNFSIREMHDLDNFMNIFRKYVGIKANLKSHHYSIIIDLISKCLEKDVGYLSALYNWREEVLAMNFIVKCGTLKMPKSRDILLFNASSKLIQSNAMTILVDHYIQQECLKNKVLDFEGSNISGVKRFYKSFGAIERNYLHIKK
ncbi:MAG: hypothetical protein CMD23_00310 [Flavobacteriales bacterium]|nr:hypothetical protein [Flavobacteriales bacterium]